MIEPSPFQTSEILLKVADEYDDGSGRSNLLRMAAKQLRDYGNILQEQFRRTERISNAEKR